MKLKKNKIFATLLVGLAFSTGYAQEATSSSGGNVLGNGGSVAYSVGQVIYTTNSGSGGTVTQGVQQPYEIFTVGIKETALNISLTIFPNPTATNLTLQVPDFTNENLTYQLLDMQGKLIETAQITASQMQINMDNLPAATYLLNVIQENKRVQTFKIIKKTN